MGVSVVLTDPVLMFRAQIGGLADLIHTMIQIPFMESERRDERQVCFPPRRAMEKLQKKWLIELHKLIESHGQQEAPS